VLVEVGLALLLVPTASVIGAWPGTLPFEPTKLAALSSKPRSSGTRHTAAGGSGREVALPVAPEGGSAAVVPSGASVGSGGAGLSVDRAAGFSKLDPGSRRPADWAGCTSGASCWWPPADWKAESGGTICGKDNWWDSYAARHREIMGDFPRGGKLNSTQVLIYLAREGEWTAPFRTRRASGGVSDRFTGLVSLFLLAIATDRAFLIDWQGVRPFLRSPLLGDALYVDDYTSVMAALPSSYVGTELTFVRGKETFNDTAFNKVGYLFSWARCKAAGGLSAHLAMCWDFPFQGHRHFWALTEQSLSRGPVIARAGHGAIHRWWKRCRSNGNCEPRAGKQDNFLAHWMQKAGLPAIAAFGCLYDMLFQPTEAVHQAFAPELEIVGTVPPPLYQGSSSPSDRVRCVMVQVRTGDATVQSQNSTDERKSAMMAALGKSALKEHHGTFECAQHAAEKLAAREQAAGWNGTVADVKWFLMTDSKLLQRMAKAEYGDRLFTHEGTVDFYATLGAAGTLSVIGEQWLGTFCGAHVVTKKSGLGRQSAARSRAFVRGEGILLYAPSAYRGCQNSTYPTGDESAHMRILTDFSAI